MTSPENKTSAQTPVTKPPEESLSIRTSARIPATKPPEDSFQKQTPPDGSSVEPTSSSGRDEHLTNEFVPLTGSCHCGLLFYIISTAPQSQGLCYCRDWYVQILIQSYLSQFLSHGAKVSISAGNLQTRNNFDPSVAIIILSTFITFSPFEPIETSMPFLVVKCNSGGTPAGNLQS